MTGLARAFWVVEPGRGEIRPAVLADPGPDEALVRARFGAISRGTEGLVFRGEVPESQREAMRAPLQEGEFPGPVKYGYACVGEVIGGVAAPRGRMVFCLHPHQTAFVAHARWLVPVPDGVPAARAVLAANLETAINALWDAAPLIGQRVTVIGAGVVGCLVAWLLGRLPGVAVELVDVNRERAAIAETLGVGFASPEEAAEERDLVFHASGAPAGLARALSLAGVEARIIELSWYGARSVPLPLGEGFHSRRLSIQASQVGAVAPSMRPRWSHRRRLELALSLLTDDRLDALFTHDANFDALPETQAALAAGGDALCPRVLYPQ